MPSPGTMDTPRYLPILFAIHALSGCTYDLCIGADALTERSDATSDPIIGGSLDEADRSVVALEITTSEGEPALCSGTVIGKRGEIGWVLTAAHCVQGEVLRIDEATNFRDCTPSGDAGKCRATYAPRQVYVHPDYDPSQGYVNDFALVAFFGATADTTVTPVVGAADQLESGAWVDLAGFGRTYAGVDDPSQWQSERHTVSVSLTTVSSHFLRVDASTGKTACFGDSGGPALALIDGRVRVVGVASTADALCETRASYGRVSSIYDSFIAPIVPETPEDGEGAGGGATSSSSSTGGAGGGSGGGAADGGAAQIDDDASGCVPATLACNTNAAGAPEGAPVGAFAAVFGALALAMRARRIKRG